MSDRGPPYNAPCILCEHPHEITAATGSDKHPELVFLEQIEQFEHRLIHQLDVRHTKLWLLDSLKPLAYLRVELIRPARPRTGESLQKRPYHFRVLNRQALEERHVSFDYCLVGLLISQ